MNILDSFTLCSIFILICGIEKKYSQENSKWNIAMTRKENMNLIFWSTLAALSLWIHLVWSWVGDKQMTLGTTSLLQFVFSHNRLMKQIFFSTRKNSISFLLYVFLNLWLLWLYIWTDSMWLAIYNAACLYKPMTGIPYFPGKWHLILKVLVLFLYLQTVSDCFEALTSQF